MRLVLLICSLLQGLFGLAADERIPLLLQTPAAVRWISAEPLLGPVTIDAHRYPGLWTKRLDWVVVGGESGPGARPHAPGLGAFAARSMCRCRGCVSLQAVGRVAGIWRRALATANRASA